MKEELEQFLRQLFETTLQDCLNGDKGMKRHDRWEFLKRGFEYLATDNMKGAYFLINEARRHL